MTGLAVRHMTNYATRRDGIACQSLRCTQNALDKHTTNGFLLLPLLARNIVTMSELVASLMLDINGYPLINKTWELFNDVLK